MSIIFDDGTTTLTLPSPASNNYLGFPVPRQFSQPLANGNSRTITFSTSRQRFSFTLQNLTDTVFNSIMDFLEDQNFSEEAFSFTDPKGVVWATVKYVEGIETAAPQANGFIQMSLVLLQQK